MPPGSPDLCDRSLNGSKVCYPHSARFDPQAASGTFRITGKVTLLPQLANARLAELLHKAGTRNSRAQFGRISFAQDYVQAFERRNR